MNENVYDRIKRIILKNDNNEYVFNYVIELQEYDHEIIVETATPIEELKRGWVGNLLYETCDAINIHTCEEAKGHTFRVEFKDVLLARFLVSASYDNAIVWKYTFLKD